jgi:iron complex outermembrane recepter protein
MTAKAALRRSRANNLSIWLLSCITLIAVAGSKSVSAASAPAEVQTTSQRLDNTPESASGENAKSAPETAQSNFDVGEIVVTARKRAERVIDIPESIVALDSQSIENRGIKTIEDVGRQTPNLLLNTRQDLTTNVVIRGVGAYGDVLGVGFVIDNVPNFTDQTMRLEDLESIEILKGPQGTLYGGSSIGGLVRYVSKRPEFNFDGEARVSVGSDDQLESFAAQNLSVEDKRLALRLSGYDIRNNGYVRNSVLGIDANPLVDFGFRGALLYQPTDSVTALLTLRHSDIKTGADNYSAVPSVRDFSYDSRLFTPTLNRRVTTGAIFEVNADIGGGNQLTSISSYTNAKYQLQISGDVSVVPPGVPYGLKLFTTPGNRPTEVTTQEVRVNSPAGTTIDWLAGLYGAEIRDVLLNQESIQFQFPTSDPIPFSDFSTSRQDLAAFGTFNYHVGDLTLGGGLRVGTTRFKTNVYTEFGGPPNQAASVTSKATLPKLSLSYKLSDGSLIFATLAKGEEPGAVNTQSSGAILPYRSETALSYEVGTKGQALNHAIDYELAAFYVKNSRHQAQTNVFVSGVVLAQIANVGDARTYGVESSLRWHPVTEVTLGLNVGYLNAKWLRADNFGTPIDGLWVPNSPEFTASFNAGYSRLVAKDLKLSGNVDVNYTDAFWWNLNNSPGQENPPYWVGNARIALTSASGSWQIAVGVTNLLNTKYWNEYIWPYTPTYGVGAIAAPRQYSASLSIKY